MPVFIVHHVIRCNGFRLAFLTLLFVSLLSIPGTLRAETEAEVVQGDVRALAQAAYTGDVDRLLRYSHPRVVELLGGQAATRAAVEAALDSIARLQLKLVKMTFPRPPIFFKGTTRRYVFVPTLSIVSAVGGQMAESLNFQLGILEPGSSRWKYVEGSRVNKSNAQQLFGDFPTGVEFPQFYRKKI